MSTRILDYLDYRQEDFVTEEPVLPVPAKRSSVVSFSGLSPFDVPEQVELEASPDHSCILRFHYADSEKGEAELRPLPGDSRAAVLVGRRTGKVLQIHLRDAYDRLKTGRFEIDLRPLLEWRSSEEVREVRSLNADLISAISHRALESLSSDLLKIWSTEPALGK